MTTYQKALEVMKKYANELMAIEGVVGVGVECEGNYCYIAVYVEHERYAINVPRVLDSVEVKVKVVGRVGLVR